MKKKTPTLETMPPRATITADQVIRYQALRKQVDELTNEKDKLAAELKAALLSGTQPPRNAPVLLALQSRSRCRHSWETMLGEVLLFLPAELRTKAQAHIAQRQSERETSYALCVAANPAWEQAQSNVA